MPAPTADEFKTRFPAFEAVDDALIDAVIVETASFIDDTWIAEDINPAKMYLAAHMLVSEGVLMDPSTGQLVNSVGGIDAIKSIKVGDVSVNFGAGLNLGSNGQQSSSNLDESLTKTSYGQSYLRLRKRNVPSVLVV